VGLGYGAMMDSAWIVYEPYRAQMEPPAEHLRGMETDQMQLEKVGENVWAHAIEPYPGLAEKWREIAGNPDSKASFAAAYTTYVSDAGRLRLEQPRQYSFLREVIFEGRQYMDVWEAIQAYRCAEAIDDIPELLPDVWERLDESERLEALGEVERRLAEVAGRPPATVAGIPMEENYGKYDYGTCQICINTNPEYFNDVQEAVRTVIHEGRHAYQHYAILHDGFHHDDADVSEWATNCQQYLKAGEYGYQIYQCQPMESDAFQFEQAVRNELFKRIGR